MGIFCLNSKSFAERKEPILDIDVWGIFRVNLGRIQNNNLHPIRSQSLQRSGKAACLVGRLAEVGKAALLIKAFFNNVISF